MAAQTKMVDFFDPETNSVLQVPESQAQAMRDGGYQTGEAAKTAYAGSGPGGAVISALSSGASGATFGVSDLLIPDAVKPIVAEANKQHSIISAASKFAGGILPYELAGAATGGLGLPAVAAVGARVATGAVGSGIETAVEASKTDSPLTGEQLAMSMGIGGALAAGAEGLGWAIGKATPWVQRNINKHLESLVKEGFYEGVEQKLPKFPAADAKLNKAMASNIVDDLGGSRGIFSPPEINEPMSPIVPPEAPPPRPGQDLPSWMQPTSEEMAMHMRVGDAPMEADSLWTSDWGRTEDGEAWQGRTRAEAKGMGDASNPSAVKADATGPAPAERTWADYKPMDFSDATGDVPGAMPDAPIAEPMPEIDWRPKKEAETTGWNKGIEDPYGDNYKKTGARPYKFIREAMRGNLSDLTAAGVVGMALDAKSLGMLPLAKWAFGRRVGGALATGADKAAFQVLNNQRTFNQFLTKTLDPSMKAFAKVTRRALDSEFATGDHTFGAHDPDATYQAVQTSLPKYATDPNSLNQYYEQRYGHVFNNQQALYQNFINTNQQAMQYLYAQMPKDPRPPSVIPTPFDPPRSDKVSFLHKVNAINDPMGVLQNPTVDSVAAVEAVYPETMKVMRNQILSQLQNRTEPLTPQEAQKASILLGQPVDSSVHSQYLGNLQLTAAGQIPQGQQGTSKPGPKPKNVTIKKGLANISAPGSQQNEVENAQ